MENYAAVKERLVANVGRRTLSASTTTVRRRDRTPPVGSARIHVVPVSAARALPRGYFVRGTQIISNGNSQAPEQAEVLADLAGIGTLRGRHNAQNAAFACAAALALRAHAGGDRAGLRSFPGLAHRMEQVGRKGAVLFVNNSKATNANSAAQALACFADMFWIAGGKPKTGGIASLAGFFPRIRKAYLIGEAADEFARTLDGKVPYEIAGTLDRAVAAAARDAEASGLKEPVVLLSPACASFDQFRNFEVRGDHFRELVLALPGLVPFK